MTPRYDAADRPVVLSVEDYARDHVEEFGRGVLMSALDVAIEAALEQHRRKPRWGLTDLDAELAFAAYDGLSDLRNALLTLAAKEAERLGEKDRLLAEEEQRDFDADARAA